MGQKNKWGQKWGQNKKKNRTIGMIMRFFVVKAAGVEPKLHHYFIIHIQKIDCSNRFIKPFICKRCIIICCM